MALSGWYPDPVGDYEYRYWDGRIWTEHVASFGAQLVDPATEPAVPDVEAVLWSHGKNQLSTHRAWVHDGLARGRSQELALWMIADVDVTVNAGQGLAGLGRVALRVEYPGYVGRSHYVMSAVPHPREVGALVRKWASRNRRMADR